MKHENNGNCNKCEELFNKYEGFHEGLKKWFKAVQNKHQDAHISCAGRGSIEQEECFNRGASRAHYGQSSHNYNCAIDIFQLKDGKALWDKEWFKKIGTEMTFHNQDKMQTWFISWYGLPGSSFYELPHFEVKNWKDLVKEGKLKMVE